MCHWLQIRDRLDEESDSHLIEKSGPDPHKIEIRVQIRIQLKSRIRIPISFSRSGSRDLSSLLSIKGKFEDLEFRTVPGTYKVSHHNVWSC
jgi:hypothetical protein